MRHSLFTVLSLAVTGVLAGCRSLTAIWEHTTDLTPSDLRSLGLEAGQALPSESTIRRVLQDLDPTDLNTRLRSWLCTRTGTVEGRTVIAVDGKTMRAARLGQATGAAPPVGPGPRHRHGPDPGPGSGQVQPEIPALPVLLEPLSMDGVVVTADAMHTQVDTAE